MGFFWVDFCLFFFCNLSTGFAKGYQKREKKIDDFDRKMQGNVEGGWDGMEWDGMGCRVESDWNYVKKNLS